MTPAEVIARFRCSGRRFSGEWPCEICRGHAEQSVAALTAQGLVIVDADRLTDGIPKDASLWPDDEELAGGHFTDRTYAWWKVALGHPRAHSGCCATCGCASSCFLDVFYDAVVMSAARHALAPGTAPQPSGTIQDSQTSGDGMGGPLAPPEASTGLSDVHMEIADRHGTRRITFPDATPDERAALMHAVELDDLRTELEIARIGQRRAKETEAKLARFRTFLDEDFRQWCSPQGVAHTYATRLLEILDREET